MAGREQGVVAKYQLDRDRKVRDRCSTRFRSNPSVDPVMQELIRAHSIANHNLASVANRRAWQHNLEGQIQIDLEPNRGV